MPCRVFRGVIYDRLLKQLISFHKICLFVSHSAAAVDVIRLTLLHFIDPKWLKKCVWSDPSQQCQHCEDKVFWRVPTHTRTCTHTHTHTHAHTVTVTWARAGNIHDIYYHNMRLYIVLDSGYCYIDIWHRCLFLDLKALLQLSDVIF